MNKTNQLDRRIVRITGEVNGFPFVWSDSGPENNFEVTTISHVWQDDTDGKWFAFWLGDCYSPSMFLIQCADFQDAYQIFLDEYLDTDVTDCLEDYRIESTEAYPEYADCITWVNDVPMDTEAIQGHQIDRVTITYQD